MKQLKDPHTWLALLMAAVLLWMGVAKAIDGHAPPAGWYGTAVRVSMWAELFIGALLVAVPRHRATAALLSSSMALCWAGADALGLVPTLCGCFGKQVVDPGIRRAVVGFIGLGSLILMSSRPKMQAAADLEAGELDLS